MTVRHLLSAIAAIALLSAAPCGAAAETFPSRTITVIVPYAPGTTDQQVRVLAPVMQRLSGQTIVVENRGGAGGAIGGRAVATSAPDGYTLLYSAPAVMTTLPLIQKTPYSLADFTPVARVNSSPNVMAIRVGAPFKTLPELIAYAKANPGKVKFGSAGTGTAVHLATETFARAAGVQLRHVPFKGVSEAITQLLGGDIDLVVGIPVVVMPLVRDGKMIALAQFGATRSPLLPEVPTVKEQGVDLDLTVDIGFFGPKGLDTAVLASLEKLIGDAMASDEFKAYVKTGVISADFLPAAGYAAAVQADAKLQSELIPAIGLSK